MITYWKRFFYKDFKLSRMIDFVLVLFHIPLFVYQQSVHKIYFLNNRNSIWKVNLTGFVDSKFYTDSNINKPSWNKHRPMFDFFHLTIFTRVIMRTFLKSLDKKYTVNIVYGLIPTYIHVYIHMKSLHVFIKSD